MVILVFHGMYNLYNIYSAETIYVQGRCNELVKFIAFRTLCVLQNYLYHCVLESKRNIF